MPLNTLMQYQEKLKELLARFKHLVGAVNGRVFVDSAPIMERAWAKKSGLGWIMKVSGPLFQTERVFASILLLSMIASLLFIFVKFLENKIVKE